MGAHFLPLCKNVSDMFFFTKFVHVVHALTGTGLIHIKSLVITFYHSNAEIIYYIMVKNIFFLNLAGFDG